MHRWTATLVLYGFCLSVFIAYICTQSCLLLQLLLNEFKLNKSGIYTQVLTGKRREGPK